MTDEIRRSIVGFAALASVVLTAAPELGAQTGTIRSDRPAVVDVDFTLRRAGQRDSELNTSRPLQLASGEELVIAVTPIDQNGRRFPLNRFRLDLEPASSCRGRVDAEWSSGELRVRGGNSRGTCTVAVWVPGNLNLDYTLTFDVGGLGVTNYTRRQTEEIVTRLYRAVLQRNPDDASVRNAVAEVQRGNLAGQVESLVRSAEFQQLRQQQTDLELLTAFYQGLFDRDPDGGGLRQYQAEVGRGRHAQVLVTIVQSEEFERRLPR